VKSKIYAFINNINNNKNNNNFKFNSFVGFNTTAIGANCKTSTKKGEGCNTDM
jgi:hypothetical protein